MPTGCCRTILGYLDRSQTARKLLQQSVTPEDKVNHLYDALDLYRELLSSYQVSRRLTQAFRKELEPDLRHVWTTKDLAGFISRVTGFGNDVDHSLQQWAKKYCKDR